MATVRRHVITCDTPGCTAEIAGDSRYLARLTARDAGWKLGKSTGDRCPWHIDQAPAK